MTKVRKVLLVDDDSISNFIHLRLMSRSYKDIDVAQVRNGQEAMEYLRDCTLRVQEIPDLIFLDLHMPIMDGIEFMKAFKKLSLQYKENIQIIVISALCTPSDKITMLDLGIKTFLTKPLKEEDLESIFLNA